MAQKYKNRLKPLWCQDLDKQLTQKWLKTYFWKNPCKLVTTVGKYKSQIGQLMYTYFLQIISETQTYYIRQGGNNVLRWAFWNFAL